MRFKNFKKVFVSVLLLCATGSFVFTQVERQQMQQRQQQPSTDFEEATLKKFAEAQAKVQQIQQRSQQKMIKAIENEGLDVQTFNKIAQSQQNAGQSSSQDVSEEDTQAFNAAAKQVQTIKQGMQEKVQTAVQEEDMQMAKYQEVMRAYQQDRELQQKVNNMMSN